MILDARSSIGSQAKLLSRALYWDADHFPLESGARHIKALWEFHPEAEMVATKESPNCFNGGLRKNVWIHFQCMRVDQYQLVTRVMKAIDKVLCGLLCMYADAFRRISRVGSRWFE